MVPKPRKFDGTIWCATRLITSGPRAADIPLISRSSVLSTIARHTVILLGIGVLPLHRPTPAPRPARVSAAPVVAGVTTGSYVAVLANGQKLPWTTKVPAVHGLSHWARLDLAVLRLTPDGRYTILRPARWGCLTRQRAIRR